MVEASVKALILIFISFFIFLFFICFLIFEITSSENEEISCLANVFVYLFAWFLFFLFLFVFCDFYFRRGLPRKDGGRTR